MKLLPTSLPLKLAVIFFIITTAISASLLLTAHFAGIKAGSGDEGLDSPGWKYLNGVALVDLPGFIIVILATGELGFHPADTSDDLQDIHSAFWVARFVWPALGYFVGWIIIKRRRLTRFVVFLQVMTGIAKSSLDWWRTRRLRYNIALVIAGLLAFIAYATVCFTLLPKNANIEITPFTILFQGIGYLLIIGVANACYFIGPISERIVQPTNPERYRGICYQLGFWFSVLLPFGVPALLAGLAFFHPNYWNQSP